MTRINVVPVETLTNDHCLAEYKEITRPFNKVLNAIEKGKTTRDYSFKDKYVLGSGHETFFFNKLSWLFKRYDQLKDELIRRGFNLDLHKYHSICLNFLEKLHDTEWWGDYKPTPEEIYLNMTRLVLRSGLDNCYEELSRAINKEEVSLDLLGGM